MKPKSTKFLTYDDQQQRLEQFVQDFRDYTTEINDEIYGNKKYLVLLQSIADDKTKNFEVEYEDAIEFFRKQDEKIILAGMLQNTETYIKMLNRIAQKLLPQRRIPVDPDREMIEKYENILKEQRKQNIQIQQHMLHQKNERLPVALHKKFFVSIIFGTNNKIPLQPINHLGSSQLGNLIVTKGIVTRRSQVKPEISVATYACDVCGCENYLEVFDISYYPLTVCQSKKCKENKVSGKMTFLPSHSKFIQYQEVKIQQTPDQLKPGEVPISKTLYLRGSNINSCAPGDIILVQGILLPTRRVGFGGRFEQYFDSHILGLKVTRQKKKYIEWALTESQIEKVHAFRSQFSQQEIFEKLSASIAPEIYGMKQVKKTLVLMMAGGVTKQTQADNMKIRGEIHVALIGDPGVAKSQLLKKVATIAPRAIYTTGKGSSGVGLTAAIVKDTKTKQIALEAGALVLADMGICCIDEFDKMSEGDRTSIHEAMEQQTISIAKAGVATTLNARTSILAAANPQWGRYNHKETLHKNINLPAALLSRFDVVFVLIDKTDGQKDLSLAYHVTNVHMNQKAPQNKQNLDVSFIRTYLALAKRYKPVINEQLQNLFIHKYIEKRKLQIDVSKQGQTYTTTRSLLALVRLSIARAKLRFSNEVSLEDLKECDQILQKSQQSIFEHTQKFPKKARQDPQTEIYRILKMILMYNKEGKASYDLLRTRILLNGYTDQEFVQTIKSYSELQVLSVKDGEIMLLQSGVK